MRIVLNVTGGPHEGEAFAFDEHDTFLVGRSDSAQFRLPFKDKALSRVHFLVEVNPPKCRLMDMASTNGTFVNGRRVAAADLNDGDTIRGGKTVLVVRVEEVASESVAPIMTTCVMRASAEADDLDTAPLRSHLPALPRLAIESELGRGGMGVVYRARTPRGEAVAVKTIAPAAAGGEGVTARFLREASILRQLDHPGIVRFREIGHADDLFYFVMDLVPGVDAEVLVRETGPLPVPRAVGMIVQALDALAYAHDLGFVHRDVKPRNLLVAPPGKGDGEADSVKLADFGLARLYLDSPLSGLSFTGQVAGTYGYMPPEQITHFRDAKPPADLYAAGATLYFLLTGRRIFDFPRDVQKQLLMILQDDPVPILDRLPELPKPLAEAIHRSLNRSPKDRFPDARSMRDAIARSAG